MQQFIQSGGPEARDSFAITVTLKSGGNALHGAAVNPKISRRGAEAAEVFYVSCGEFVDEVCVLRKHEQSFDSKYRDCRIITSQIPKGSMLLSTRCESVVLARCLAEGQLYRSLGRRPRNVNRHIDSLWPKAIFTGGDGNGATTEYGLRPKENCLDSHTWGDTPGYGESWPSAKVVGGVVFRLPLTNSVSPRSLRLCVSPMDYSLRLRMVSMPSTRVSS